MSLDKAIEHGKERRRPYTGSKAIDPSCRNHGGCPWCEENRKHKFRDKKPMMEANPNVRKKLFLTASQVEMLGGYENARSLADGHEIVLIPEEIQEENIHERTAGTQETL